MRPAAYAVLNLDALQHNLARVRACAPDSRVMAVIKANAYGHGLLRVANALKGVDAFAVARGDEAVTLRKQGVTLPITVLEGFSCQQELALLLRYDIAAVVHSEHQLDILESNHSQQKLKVWLKFDSGMNRLGFSIQQFGDVYQRLMSMANISRPFALMTHLANADNLQDNKTTAQIALFEQVTKQCAGARSIANSAGILGWKQSIRDWVRPGIMLYGIAPFADVVGTQIGLLPVMSLHSRLIAVKHVMAGQAVGYGGDWVCEKDILMGVIAIGYGDGYPRQAVSGTPVLVGGVRVPLIGRVSMDMITVDLTRCPDVLPGETVTLWGEGLPVEELALHSATIPYTLVCGITQRVQIVEE